MLAEVRIPKNPPVTFYMKYGDVFSAACLLVTFAALGAVLVRRRTAVA
jgi:apolipoprotein N-acyltransferase